MIESRYVIDGQQRLTTLQLFIAAARSLALEMDLAKPAQMFEKLLFNDDFLVKQANDRFKVLPTWSDQDAFRQAVADGYAGEANHRMLEAFGWFRQAVREWAVESRSPTEIEARFDALTTVLWKLLVIVSIDLASGDNAQIIFETLNARGTPLLAADLIKNHLFQVAITQGGDIDALYERYWKPLDQEWWRAEVQQGRLKRPRLDILANYWLAMRLGHEVVSHQLFQDFKRYLAAYDGPTEAVLADLVQYAAVFLRFQQEPEHTDLGRFLYRLDTMEVTTAYPALLWMLGPEGLESVEAAAAVAAIESWLVRRMLVRATTKNYNTVFISLLRELTSIAELRRPVADNVVTFFSRLGGESQSWPTDEEVARSLRVMPAYTSLTRSRLRMVLEAVEAHLYTGLTEKVLLGHDLTVEHVLPQEWRPNWPLPDGVDPIAGATERDTLKHTFGNLTLVTGKLNPAMSNAAWPTKREALRQNSILKMSVDLRAADVWDEEAIRERTKLLSSACVGLWSGPVAVELAPGADDEAIDGAGRGGSPAAAQVYAIADAAGVGSQLRRVVKRCVDAGFHVRHYPYSVMISTPADRRVMVFTAWPQANEPHTFVIWRAPEVLVKLWPCASQQAAEQALGPSGRTVISAREFEAIADRVADLVASPPISQH
jgi:hypothetical protein